MTIPARTARDRSSQMAGDNAVRLLTRFAEAWAARDLEGVMACFTEDCVYSASVGPRPEFCYVGKAQVRAGVENMFLYDRVVRSEVADLIVSGDRAAWRWIYHTTDGASDGIVEGCDLFELRDGLISKKDAYRKVRTET